MNDYTVKVDFFQVVYVCLPAKSEDAAIAKVRDLIAEGLIDAGVQVRHEELGKVRVNVEMCDFRFGCTEEV